jgi:hypothetical protein
MTVVIGSHADDPAVSAAAQPLWENSFQHLVPVRSL